MTEEAELQAKIAALAGRINQHKQTGGAPPSNRGNHQGTQRWNPYGRQQTYYRGGGYARPAPPAHRNRTLVVNNNSTPDVQQTSPSTPGAQAIASWVSKRDRHMQLINTAVYDQKVQQRQKAMEETAQQKQQQRDEKEKNKVIKHFQGNKAASSGTATPVTPRLIEINGLQFRIAPDGSKLTRVFGEFPGQLDNGENVLRPTDGPNSTAQATPKQAEVAGVKFYRSKNGNLYRNSLVKTQRAKTVKKTTQLCPRFTATGTCSQGNRCRYTHDVTKLAICKDFLRHGSCAAGEEACNLSHDPNPHRSPACIHFLNGNCTNPDCRYAHVHVNPSAPVCREFATIGYCEKGADCAERHVIECPDYANTGVCRDKKCRLPHVDRAGNLRKAAAARKAANNSDDNESSDLSSDEDDFEEIDSDDYDSGEDIVMTGSGDNGHELSQQQDFISFA